MFEKIRNNLILQFVVVLLFFSCRPTENKKNGRNQKPVDTTSVQIDSALHQIFLHPLSKLFVTGDFDGDHQKDTIFEHNFSHLRQMEIDRAADPFQNEWDAVTAWFLHEKSDVYLAFNKTGHDTLHLGPAQGLYCLLNIGDNNADGKDEIAFVVDYLDYSRTNTCMIYSLCQRKWAVLQDFGIHEDAFNFTSETAPEFKEVQGFLEKHKNKWVYKDYMDDGAERMEDVGKMKKLKLAKCQ